MSGASAYQQVSRQDMDRLVTEYLPLVKKIAMYWSARLPASIELDDLMQVGMIGLIQASESYDASRGAGFGTYASIRIKGAIIDEVRRNDWVPRSVQKKMADVATAVSAVEARTGAVAGDRDIAQQLGVSLEDYYKITAELTCCRMTSLDQQELEHADESGGPVPELEEAAFRQVMADEILRLPEKEQLMMSLYYGDELNLKEIGLIMGVSESRVSQIHGQALARLRSRMSDWSG